MAAPGKLKRGHT